MKKKDKAHIENALTRFAISIVGLAAALATIIATGNSTNIGLKMSAALASATKLLASHCIELVKSVRANHDYIAFIMRSTTDFHSPGDLKIATKVDSIAFSPLISLP